MTSRAVILDLDETLYRERRFALSGYAAVARHVSADTGIAARSVFASLARSLRSGRRQSAFQEACEAFGLDRANVPAWVQVYRSHTPRLALPRGVTEVVLALRAASWRIGILTNGLPEVQRAKVRALGLDGLVNAVVFADEHGGKPAAVAFTTALKRLGVSAERSVVVGDDPVRDVEGARRAGLRAVWLCRRRRPGVTAPAADAEIRSLSELPDVLARLGIDEVQHAH